MRRTGFSQQGIWTFQPGLTVLLAFAGIAAVSVPVCAQARAAAQQAPQQVSRERLDRYASVLAQVIELRQNAHRQAEMLPATQRPGVRQRLARDVSQLLSRSSLASEEFNRMTRQVDRDPELRERLRQRVLKKLVGI